MHERSSTENLNSPDMCRSQHEPTDSTHNENVDNKLSSHFVTQTKMGNNTKNVLDNVVDNRLSQPSGDNMYVSLREKGVVTSLLAISEVAARHNSPSSRHHTKAPRRFLFRRGSEEQKDKIGAKLFNDFIYDLVDLLMGGRKFTRMNKYGTKLSKIDRILVTQHFLSMCPNAQRTALPRDLSDHCPIIIKTHHADFSPIPFKFYNSWLLNDELSTIISHSWSAPLNRHTIHHLDNTLKCKLQLLKSHIREWGTDMLQNEANKIGKIRNEIQLLDLKA
ncbi:cytochrome P450 [Tanacetum coccineum]